MTNNSTNENCFNYNGRLQSLTANSAQLFDLIVIGGGITGAGICLDASSRGLSTLLIEKNDFASGTSSRSTKLIHGGLRYLKSLEFGLVRTVGKERAILYKNAPHLIIPQNLILPIYKNGNFRKWQLRIALALYDFLAGVQKNEKMKILSVDEALVKEPLLKKNELQGAGIYSEYRTDDARLTLEIIKTSLNYGSFAYNYIEATSIRKENEKFIVSTKDYIYDKSFVFTAKQVVNATGPWTDDLRKINHLNSNQKICLSKGVHIVLKHKDFPLKKPVYFDALENRMCFAIPRNNCTYVGTTDTIYTNSNKQEPRATISDIQYIIDSINNSFNIPNKITPQNIISSWTGLRPLIHQKNKQTKELSRKDELIIDNNNMISIAGGKLTGYRIMAKKTTDLVCEKIGIDIKCQSQTIKLSSSNTITIENLSERKKNCINKLFELSLSEKEAENLFHTYGHFTHDIIDLFQSNNYKNIIEAEALFCLKNESTYSLVDFFLRRTSKLHYSPEKINTQINLVLPIFSAYLKLTKEKEKKLLEELRNHQTILTKFQK